VERLLTVDQAGRILNVHGETVRQWLRSGKLRGVKLGRRSWRVPETALRELTEVRSSDQEGPRTTAFNFQEWLAQVEEFRAALERKGVSFEGIDGAELVRAGREERTRRLLGDDD